MPSEADVLVISNDPHHVRTREATAVGSILELLL
jgi:hypothetical protein